MAPNTMRTTSPSLVPRIVPARCYHRQSHQISRQRFSLTPTRQTVSSAKCQLQVRFPLTPLHLTPCRCLPIIPPNTLTRIITGLHPERATGETVAKEGAEVVPDGAVVDVVGENQLTRVWDEQTAGLRGNLERITTGGWVGVEFLAVGGVFGERDLGADVAADGPQVNRAVALVCDNRSANGEDGSGEGGKSEDLENAHVAACRSEMVMFVSDDAQSRCTPYGLPLCLSGFLKLEQLTHHLPYIPSKFQYPVRPYSRCIGCKAVELVNWAKLIGCNDQPHEDREM